MTQPSLIWDFDGTLYDTYPSMTRLLLEALAGFGVREDAGVACALIKGTLYGGVAELARRHGLDGDALLTAFQSLRRAHEQMEPMPGLDACLRDTARMGCRHFLFTHRDSGALHQLAADGLLGLFTEAVTRECGFADKPAPDAVLHLMRKYGFTAADALMVGDRDIDILSGRAAGVRGVLLDPGGFYPDLYAEYRIQSLTEVAGVVRQAFPGMQA